MVHEADLLDGIFGGVEFFEDGKDDFCDAAVDHHFAVLRFPMEVHIADAEKSEVFAGDGAARFERFAFHDFENGVRNGLSRKTFCIWCHDERPPGKIKNDGMALGHRKTP